LLQDEEFYIRVQAAQALVQFGDARAIAALESRLTVEQEGRVIRVIRESLLTLGAGAADAVRRLSDDVTGLQRKFDEMRARVERVEANRGETPPNKPAPQRGAKRAALARRPAVSTKAASRRKPAAAKGKTSKRPAPVAASRKKKTRRA